MPAVIRFLGYNPQPAAKTWGGRVVRYRASLGMTQAEPTRRIGVDVSTLARWEQGKRQPDGELLGRVKA